MNTIINSTNYSYHPSNKGRILKFDSRVPNNLRKVVAENPAVQKFLNSGKPNTFLEKFLDFLKKDKNLEVVYNHYKVFDEVVPDCSIETLEFHYEDKSKMLKSCKIIHNTISEIGGSIQEQLSKLKDLEQELKA